VAAVGIKWSSGPSHLGTYRREGWIWTVYFCLPNIRKDSLNIVPTYKLNPHYNRSWEQICTTFLYLHKTRWQCMCTAPEDIFSSIQSADRKVREPRLGILHAARNQSIEWHQPTRRRCSTRPISTNGVL